MPARHVVVDGSNIATEGRSLPSLVQLDVAVREYRREFPEDVITVVVDATFGHRIDSSERADFDEAVAHNEIVSPPAGAIGRGDAFLLRVAEKVGATVLSNDSFQEFHGEHEWLFNNGRLIGGKPVPGVGWIFTPRTPVRGPKSRDSMREARRTKPAKKDEINKVQRAIEVATEEAVEPDSPKVKRRRRSRGGAPPADPVNDPLPFIEFVAAHPLGSTVDAEVESFSSHGAFVTSDGLRCYIPLSGLGDPAPRAAKEVLKRGETRQFVLQALDPPRRGIELALPGFAHVSGVPTAETVEEEIREGASRRPSRRKRGGRGRTGDDELVEVGAGDEGAAGGSASSAGLDVPAAVAEAGSEVMEAQPAPKARKAGRGRKAAAAKVGGGATAGEAIDDAPVPAPVAAEPVGARTRRGRGPGREDASPAPTPAAPTEPPPAEAVEPTGPKKRQARPRAGAARTQPSPAPTPLTVPVPEEAPTPAGRTRAPRKAVVPVVETPAVEAVTARPSRPSRRRAAPADAPTPAVTPQPDPDSAPIAKVAKRVPAARKTAAPTVAAETPAGPPARKAPARKAAAQTTADPTAAVPAPADIVAKVAAKRVPAKKAVPAKAATTKTAAPKAAAKKAPAKKAAAKKSARKP